MGYLSVRENGWCDLIKFIGGGLLPAGSNPSGI